MAMASPISVYRERHSGATLTTKEIEWSEAQDIRFVMDSHIYRREIGNGLGEMERELNWSKYEEASTECQGCSVFQIQKHVIISPEKFDFRDSASF